MGAKPIFNFKFESDAGAIQQRFQVVGGKVVDVVRNGIHNAVKAIAQDARTRAPVAAVHRVKYGLWKRKKRLKQEIRYKVGETNMLVWGYVRAEFPALFQELGTGQYFVGEYARPPKHPNWAGHKRHSFLKPAFDAHKAQAVKDMAGKI